MGQVPLDRQRQRHVDASGEGDGGEGVEEVRVEHGVEPALQLEDGRDVHGDPGEDEQDVEAGQHDEQVVERVLPHLPRKVKQILISETRSWIKN